MSRVSDVMREVQKSPWNAERGVEVNENGELTICDFDGKSRTIKAKQVPEFLQDQRRIAQGLKTVGLHYKGEKIAFKAKEGGTNKKAEQKVGKQAAKYLTVATRVENRDVHSDLGRNLESYGEVMENKVAEIEREMGIIEGGPEAFNQLCDFVEDHLLKEQGVFRVSAQEKTIVACRKDLGKGKSLDLKALTKKDVHIAPGLIKRDLQEMNPRLLSDISDELLAREDHGQDSWIQETKKFIETLSPEKQAKLKRLVMLCEKIAENKENTDMPSANLGTTPGATLFEQSTNVSVVLTQAKQHPAFFQAMIDNRKKLFD